MSMPWDSATQVATYEAFNYKLSQTTKPEEALHIDSQCYKKYFFFMTWSKKGHIQINLQSKRVKQ